MATLELPPNVDEAHARLVLAVGLFQEDGLSVGRAAEIAGLSYRAFADALHARGIPAYTVTEAAVAEDIAFADTYAARNVR